MLMVLLHTVGLALQMMKQGAMLTVLSTLITALAWPAALLAATDFIDSKWTIAVDRYTFPLLTISGTELLDGKRGKLLLVPFSFELHAHGFWSEGFHISAS